MRWKCAEGAEPLGSTPSVFQRQSCAFPALLQRLFRLSTSTPLLHAAAESTAAESRPSRHTPCRRRPGRSGHGAACRACARCGLHSECARSCGTRDTSWTTRPQPGTALSRSTSLLVTTETNERDHCAFRLLDTTRDAPGWCQQREFTKPIQLPRNADDWA